MDLFGILALVITLAALFSYVNHRTVGMPTTIGVMVMSLAASLLLVLSGTIRPDLLAGAREWVSELHFSEALLQGMLSFLLFAGALHIDLGELAEQKWPISVLALFGTVASTFLVGTLVWLAADLVQVELSYLHCLIFGAIISPTDPVAVLGILKNSRAPASLKTTIAGESLFNDGVGVVLFLVLLESAAPGGAGGSTPTVSHVAAFFAREALGGAAYGLVIGYVTYRLLRSVDDYHVEVLLTLAMVSGGYALAHEIHVSGPIAIVVAGLLIGNKGRLLGMSETTRRNLDIFWELVDEVLNAVLFVLIGFEALALSLESPYVRIGLVAIPIVLLARLASVGLPLAILSRIRPMGRGALTIMTWGGLRGGISVALALSIPAVAGRHAILAITYPVVVFSILVQGLTIGAVTRRVFPPAAGDPT